MKTQNLSKTELARLRLGCAGTDGDKSGSEVGMSSEDSGPEACQLASHLQPDRGNGRTRPDRGNGLTWPDRGSGTASVSGSKEAGP